MNEPLSPAARAFLQRVRTELDPCRSVDDAFADLVQRARVRSPAPSRPRAPTLRRVLTLVAVLALVGGAAALRRDDVTPPPARADAFDALTFDAAPVHVPAPTTAVAPAPVAPAIRAAAPQPVRVRPERRTRAAVVDPVAAEISLLEPARRAVASDELGAARELLREHVRLHPRGRLAAERDALLAIIACREGSPSATHEVADFLRGHAGSAYAQRVLDECPTNSGAARTR